MKDILTYIITAIVEHPKDITVSETEENGTLSYSVSVAKEDMGKVIGKEGKVIRAVRNIMKIPAIKQGKRIEISLQEV
ncbi:MAG: KH domain-containing protein [Candidatus Levybacteria bacterium]|nr:KH domain-containing protein [Candidatus Levybacteria bacterium]